MQASRQATRSNSSEATTGGKLRDTKDNVVGLMARSFRPPQGMKCASAQVSAICVWDRQHVNGSTQSEDYTKGLRSDRWEVVVPTLMFEPEQPPATACNNGHKPDTPTNTGHNLTTLPETAT